MKNKNVGWLIVGISVFVFIIIGIFNFGVKEIISSTCSHGSSCSMYTTLTLQTWISIAIALVILMIGIFLIFSKESERIIIKKIKPTAEIRPKEFNKKSLETLDKEEKEIMNLLLEKNGSMYQSEIVNITKLGKVKITRILDSLEGMGLIERKRRGMTNIVLLLR